MGLSKTNLILRETWSVFFQRNAVISLKHQVLHGILLVSASVSFLLSAYLFGQNWILKAEAIRYAESDASLEASLFFLEGHHLVFKMDGECDEDHFSGQHDGVFEVWIVVNQASSGAAQHILTEHWVEKFNEQMQRLTANPEQFLKHHQMILNTMDDSKSKTNFASKRPGLTE